MRAIDAAHAVFARFAGLFAKFAGLMAALQRQPDFVCGDCERWARCGLAASDDCVVKAAQIARGDWKMRRRVKAWSLAMGGPAAFVQLKTRSWE
jgi:hypothetical protein